MASESAPCRLLRSLTLCLSLVFVFLAGSVHAEVTVYQANNQAAFTTSLAPGATYSGVAAYNPTTLSPPPLPTSSVLTTIPINLQNSGTPNLGIKQKGSFIGFSIEMSVTNQVLGKNSTLIQVPFLNLMANIQQRAGSVMIRVGGNTQESAKLVADGVIPDGRVLTKNLTGVTGTTQTPPLEFNRDLLYMMRNISGLVNVHWFLGIPWFVTTPFDTGIITAADEILGDYLLGLQAGNEPDMYNLHGHRGSTYSPFDYGGEMSDLLTQVAASGADPSGRAMSILVAPNIADFAWTPELVWNSGLVDKFANNLAYLAVEKYPRDNCAATFGGPGANVTDPQSVLPLYLTHDAHTQLLAPYLNSTMYAQSVGKPFLMFETNTASCGGFLGVSDSFTAALWGLDYALQMAHSNFSGAMFHLGGQNVFYNPFTSPPTNESTFHQWSVGPLYYSALVMAEAIGPSNNTQVFNYGVTDLSSFTPIYGIYENGTPVRVAVFNYLDDPSGANTVHAVIAIAGATMPSSVKVKYLAAASVVQKGGYTWAGQTFGGFFESDGRPTGQEDVQTVQCNTTAQTCTVDVPAPGFALVFLTDDAFTESKGAASVTFPTTAQTKTKNTATVDPSVLSTSNGYRMADHPLAGTSKAPSAAPRGAQASLVAVGVIGVTTVLAILGRAM
ncbi:glycoside hydrolase family 79 protein [Mycena albidolilacea]|uniref:Glycoside hydrolase family 79 protein n=1 Tax=Mycena albidolilacea TaxID=1033008 RepID=A0AAD7EL22_9AGAR|nr:glycoside hydrolase family 79 protein [Mycena albidolilacea]